MKDNRDGFSSLLGERKLKTVFYEYTDQIQFYILGIIKFISTIVLSPCLFSKKNKNNLKKNSPYLLRTPFILPHPPKQTEKR